MNSSLKTLLQGIIFSAIVTYSFAQTIIPANSTITDPIVQGYATCTPGNCVIQTTSGGTSIASGTATNSLLFWNGTAWTETTAASLNSAGQATLTNATTTNFFATLLNAVTAIFTNLTTTNLVATNATNTNLISSDATITSATITNLYAPNIFGSVASATFAQSTTIGATVTNATNTGIFFLHNGVLTQDTTNFNYDYATKKLTVTGGIDPQYFQAKDVLTPGQNAAYYEAYSGDAAALSAANTGRLRYATSTQSWQISNNGGAYQDIVVSGGNISWANATGGNATITNIYSGGTFTLTNGTIVGANITDATITNATSTNLFANLFNAVSAFISTITAGVINVGTINATTTINTLALNASTTNASTTNTDALLATNGTITNATATNISTANISGTNANLTNIISTDATITNATVTNLSAGTVTLNSINATNGTITNSTSTNISTTNLTSANTSAGELLANNATITNSTSTNLFSTLINAITAAFTGLTATDATITNATSTNFWTSFARILDFTSNNATITNATTTNFATANSVNSGNSSIAGTLGVTGTSTLATTSVSNISISDAAILASTTPSTTTNALYNINGNLYFNGTQLGVAGAGTEWQTINNSGVRLSTTSNSVVIGASATSTTDNFQVIGTAYINGTTTLATTTITNGVITNIAVAGGSATLTDATSTFLQIYNLTAATTTLGTTTISTSSITNLNVLSTLWANILSVLNFTADNATITNATSSNIATTNLTATGTAVIANANVTNATISNATSTSLFANLINSVSAFISTITAGIINVGTINATTTINTLALNASTTNASTTNTIDLVSTGTSTFATTTAASSTVGTANIGTANISNLNISGLTVPNATISFATVTNDLAVTNVNATGTITGVNGVFTNGTITNATVTGNISGNTISASGNVNLSGTNTFATTTISTSSISFLNVLDTLWTNLLSVINLNFTNATGTNATTTGSFVANNFTATGTTLLATTSIATATIAAGTAVLTDATITNATSTNIVSTNITASNITNTNLTSGSATITNSTSTNIYTSNLTSDNTNAGTLVAGTTTLGTTTISTSSISNLNVLATLWANILSVLNFSATNATITNSTSSNIAVGNLTATGTTNLATTTSATTSVSLLAVGTSTNASTTLTAFRNVANGGVTWTSRSASEANTWSSVTYGNGTFVAVSGSGTNRVMTSTDGITWTARTASEANPWWAVTYGGGQFVAVSTSGTNQVMTSPDGITWTARAASASSQWRSVVYANGKYVAVASAGATRAMTSTDGITWTSQTAVTSAWRSVTYGNGVYVAVAESGADRVMTSPDGITWTDQTAAEANSWQSVIYAGGQFVAVALDGTNQVMTSPDGVTWTARAASEASAWNSVTYANGTYVAVASSGTNRVMTSSDAITWTSRSASEASIWYSVAAGNGLLVAVAVSGTNQVMTSVDGPTGSTSILSLGTSLNSNVLVVDDRGYVGVGTTTGLTNLFNINGAITLNSSTPASTANALYSQSGTLYWNGSAVGTGGSASSTFAFSGGNIISASSTANIVLATSTGNIVSIGSSTQAASTTFGGTTSTLATLNVYGDIYSKGLTWTAQATPGPTSNWESVVYGNGIFVALAWTGTNRVMTSSDGVNWTARSVPEANQWNGLAYGNGLFVAVAGSGTNRVMTSPDGITWTARSAAEANAWNEVMYGNGLFVAVAGSGTNRVMTSPDGITWTARSAAAANSWRSVTYGNGMFVAVAPLATGNGVMRSTDGINWTIGTTAADNNWFDVEFGNGIFVAVSSNGTGNRVMTSQDGLVWTSRNTTGLESGGWSSVAYGDGLFVAVQSSGNQVVTSPDGITWTGRTAAVANQWSAITYGNGMFVAVGESALGSQVMTSGRLESNFAANQNQNIFTAFVNFMRGFGIGTSTNIYGGELTSGITLGLQNILGTNIANTLVLGSATGTANVSTSTNALYNVNGTLYFNGSQVGTGALPASSTSLYVGTNGGVAIGTTTNQFGGALLQGLTLGYQTVGGQKVADSIYLTAATSSSLVATTSNAINNVNGELFFNGNLAGISSTSALSLGKLIFGQSFGNILSAIVGSTTWSNFSGGIGTGGVDGTGNAERLTAQGNLTNIGNIQAGSVNISGGINFGTATNYNTSSQAYKVVAADFNGDGYQDIANVYYTGAGGFGILLNDKNGGYSAVVNYGSGGTISSSAIEAGDVDGDGRMDVVVTNQSAGNTAVWYGLGNGTFSVNATSSLTGHTAPYGSAIGDVNGDGRADIITANNSGTNIGVNINQGNRTFATRVNYTFSGNGTDIELADVNGDGKADILVAGSTVDVLLNNGNGTFAAVVNYSGSSNPNSIEVADVNGDKSPDLVYTTTGSYVGVRLNNGNGTFASETQLTTTGLQDIAVSDLNGDGVVELVTANNASNYAVVFVNNGTGGFTSSTTVATANDPYSVTLVDTNNDGKKDIVTGNLSTGNVSVVKNSPITSLFTQVSNGAVAIGTTTNIYGGALTSGLTIGGSVSNGTYLANTLVISAATGTSNISTSTNALYNVNGTLYFNGSAVASGGLPASSTSLYVAADGKVAVGTSTPSANLDVIGSIKSQINSNANLAVAGTLTAAGAGGRGMIKSGDYVFTTGVTNTVRIVDVSVPNSPRLITNYTTGTTTAANMAIVGKYLYVTHQQSPGVVTTHDISNISAPVQVATTTLTHNTTNRIVQNGKYLYIHSESTSGLTVLDISGGTPTVAAVLPSIANATEYIIKGNYMYGAVGSNIRTYNISNPINPTLVNTSSSISGLYFGGMSITGRYGYVAAITGNVLATYDFVNAAAPVFVATTSMQGGQFPTGIFANSKYVFVADNSDSGFSVFDITASSTAPALVATTSAATVLEGAQSLVVSGNYAYLNGGTNFTVVSLGGIDAGTILAGNAEIGELTVLQKLIAQASLLVKDLLQVDGNANVGGTLTTKNASVNNEIVLGNNTPATTSNALYNQGGTLYFNGSQLASGLSSLEVTFDENISNGTAVQLYNDGTNIRAKSVGVSGTGSAGNISTMSGGLVVDDSAQLGAYSGPTVWVNDSTVVVGMRNASGAVQKFRAATVSGITPTFGSTLVSAHAGENNYLIPLPRSGSNRFIGLSNTLPNIGVFSVSGTTISEGTRGSLNFNASSPGISGVETAVNEVAVIGSNGSTPVSVNIVDISGTSISSVSSNITVDSSPTAAPASYGNFDIAVVATTSATTTIAVSYTNGSNIYVRVGDVNSTTNTVEWGGSPVAVAATTQTVMKIARYADRKLAVMFYNSAGNTMQMQLVDISGANVPSTLGGIQTIGSVTTSYQFPDLVNTSDNVLLAQFGASASNAVTQYIYNITVSGSSITATQNTLAASARAYNTNGPLSVNPSGTNFATTYAVDDTNYLTRLVLGVMSAGASDTRSQYFGVVSSSTVANATGTVALYGSVLSNVITNLVAGATYYIDSTGQLTTNVTNYVAGKALSSTQLSLNAALQPPASVSSGSTNVAASYLQVDVASDCSNGANCTWTQTPLASYGSDITLDSGNTSYIRLKAGKTYKLTANAFLETANSFSDPTVRWINESGSTIGQSAYNDGGGNTGTDGLSQQVVAIYTPTTDTYVRLAVSGGTGVVDENTNALIEVIAGNAAVTGQSVDYINANITSVQSVANGAAIPFVTTAGNIANSSGVFTLSAGKTYRLTGGIAYDQSNGTSGSSWRWRDITNNTLIGSSAFANSSQQGVNEGSQPIAEAVITPTTNITVRLENIGGSTKSVAASSGSNGGTWATIQQLGSSATTEYSNNILGNFTASSTIMSGTLSQYINHIQIQQASSSITLSIPNPDNASSSRIVYIDNTGTANFDMHGVTVGAGETAAFKWNGTTWKSFGNQAANVAAENGEVTTITDGQSTTSTSFVDVTGSSFTIPSAGTWRVTYVAQIQNTTASQQIFTQLTDSSGTLVPGSYLGGTTAAGLASRAQTAVVTITTTGPATYKMQWKVSAGTGFMYNNTGSNGQSGQSRITYQKIGGYLPVIGQTVEYVYATNSGTSAPGTTAAIPFTTSSGNIPNSSGDFTLSAGKTYRLQGTIRTNQANLGVTFNWYNVTTAADVGTSAFVSAGSGDGTNTSTQGIAELVITPSVTTVVRLRSQNAGTISANAGWVTIQQLGTTAITGVTWSSLLAPIANLTTNMSTFATNFSWTATTSSTTVSDVASTTGLFNLTANSLAIGNLLNIDTSLASSSVLAMRVKGSIAKVFGTNFATSTPYAHNVDFGNTSRVRVLATTSAFQGITGIANGQDGEELTIVNASSTQSFTLYDHTSTTTSLAANRIITGTGADLTLNGDAAITLVYDSTASTTGRWRIVGGTGGGTSVSSTNLTNFTASSTVGTAALTVDTYTNLNIAQASTSVVLTLPNPTITTAGKTITVNNTGTAAFTMHDVQVPSLGSGIFVWNGTFWSSIEGKGNVAAEYGENTTITDAQTTTSASLTDVTGGSFTLPSAGVWEVEYKVFAQNTTNGTVNYQTFVITDNSNNAVASCYSSNEVPASNTALAQSQVCRITTTGTATYKLRWSTVSGTATLYNNTNNGNSKIAYKKISGNAAVTGQTVDYINVYNSALIGATGAGGTVIFNTIAAGNIPYNTTTGLFTLTAGKTYKLSFSVQQGSGSIMQWQTSAGVPLNGSEISNSNANSIASYDVIYTPTVNTDVKLITLSSIALGAQRASAVITQLGSTATTEYQNNILSNFTASSTITATLSEYINHYQIQQASSSVVLTIPNPTNTTLSRIIYIDNTGTANFQMHDVTVGAGETVAFKWNGTTWKSFGNQAANVAAEYGENTTITNGQNTSSASFADVTNGGFTLPTAGTWEVEYNIYSYQTNAGQSTTFAITDTSNNVVANSSANTSPPTGNVNGLLVSTQKVFITTTGSASYKMRWATGGAGTATISNTNATGASTGASSKITWKKIGGYLPVIGQSVDYINITKTSDQSISGTVDSTWNVTWSAASSTGNIPFDGTSAFTLTAGKTYALESQLVNGASNSFIYRWVDANTNNPIGNSFTTGISKAPVGSLDTGSFALASVVYTPTTNQTVKVRIIDVSGATQAEGGVPTVISATTGGTSYVKITQLGSSAMTSESIVANGGQLSTDLTIGTLANNFFRIIASSTEYMRVLATGQGLIGTTTINTTIGTSTLAIVGTSSAVNANILSLMSSTSQNVFKVTSDGMAQFGNGTSTTLSGANVQMSTLGDTYNYLQIRSNTNGSPTNGQYRLDIGNGYSGDDKYFVWGYGTRALSFGTNGLERMRVTGTGQLLVGTTTTNTTIGTSTLSVVGTTTDGTANIFNISSSTGLSIFNIANNGSIQIGTSTKSGSFNFQAIATTSNILSIASSTGANVLTISAAGGVGIGTSTNILGGSLTSGLTLNNALVLASSTAISTTTFAIYNKNGTLFWNGSAINTSVNLAQSYGSVLKAFVGSSTGYTSFSGGIGTGGVDSQLSAQRITNSGNLVNIGNIQNGGILSTAGGTFRSATGYDVEGTVRSISIGDLNGDGDNEILTSNNGSSSMTIYWGNGTGLFTASTTLTTASGPAQNAIGDLNGDGRLDIVVNYSGSAQASVFLNVGGTFPSRTEYTIGSSASVTNGNGNIAIGDVNGDGRSDLVVPTGSTQVSVLINKGDGTFATKVDYTNPHSATGAVLGDFNGDGKADMAVGTGPTTDFSVRMNNGDGTFGAATTYTAGVSTVASALAAADLNNDGSLDIAVQNTNGATVSVFLNTGNGTFAPKVEYSSSNGFGLGLADMNGDGYVDLVPSNFNTPSGISVLYNNGNGTFGTRVHTPDGGVNGYTIAVGDLNNDGKPDTVTAASTGSTIRVLLSAPRTMIHANAYTGLVSIGTSTATSSSNALLYIANSSSTSATDLFKVASSSGANILTISSAGNVGVGTTTINSALSIQGATGAGLLSLNTSSGANALTVNSVGRLSLGTTSSFYASEIALAGLGAMRLSAPVGSDNVFTFNSRGADVFSMRSTNTNNTYLNGINGATLYLGASGGVAGSFVNQMAFTPAGNMMIGGGTANGLLSIASSTMSGTASLFSIGTTTNGNIMTVRADGNIGIGTTTPTTLLSIASSTGSASILVSASGTDAAAVFNNTGANTSYYIGAGATSSGIGNGNFGIYDLKNSAARLIVSSAGLVGIGTSTPDAVLSLGGTNTGISFKDNVSGDRSWFTRFTDRLHINSSDEVRIMGGATNSTDGNGLVVESAGHVRPSGNNTLTLGTGSFRWTEVFATNGTINTSDARLKENILDLTNKDGLDTVLALRPVTYNWIDRNAGNQTNFGFLAQEVYNINPELVSGTTTGSSTLGINYTNFIPLLTKAVQQLNAKVFGSGTQQAISIEEITASSTISVDDKLKALGMNAKQVNDMLAQLASTTSATSSVTTTETVNTSTQTYVCAADTQVGTSMNGGIVTSVTSTTTPVIVEGSTPTTITNCVVTTYSTTTTVTEDLTFVGKVIARVVEAVKAMLATASSVFINKVETKELCVTNDAGEKTCLTKEQLDNLIQNATNNSNNTNNNSGNSNPPAPETNPETPTPEPQPEPEPEPQPEPEPAPETPTPEPQPQPEPTPELQPEN